MSESVSNKVKCFVNPSPWVGYSDDNVNLSIGAPGPDLLKRCCSMFEKATTHRMVFLINLKSVPNNNKLITSRNTNWKIIRYSFNMGQQSEVWNKEHLFLTS